MKRLQKGFTMIELLIVIAVLGILAVAVLAAINPIEQINRGRDTGSRSDAEQLIGAIDRYYTANGYYPWQDEPDDDADTGWIEVDAAWVSNGPSGDIVLDRLSSVGTAEVKASFTDRISQSDYNTLFVYNEGTQGDSTYVCFLPRSQNFLTESTNRCGGSLPGDFPETDACADPDYYSCLP